MSGTRDTQTSFPTVARAVEAMDNPIIRLLDRFIVWFAVGLCALLILGGKTWLNGQIEVSPAIDSSRKTISTLTQVQQSTSKDVQSLAVSVQLLVQQMDQHERRLNRIEDRTR